MKVFLTGGTGYIGSEVARRLRRRGDDVVALVRTPGKAGELEQLGCDLVPGDLGDDAALRAGMSDCQAVIHAAAMYEVGIKASRRELMFEANVRGTERVLQAAQDLGIPRVVYVSTCGVFGNTDGKTVDETHRHGGESFASYYEETKFLAHEVALRFISEGLPAIIVMPGFTYGPDDPSAIGSLVDQFIARKMPALPMPTVGGTFVHRDDVADGILLALDKGLPGESYVLGGEVARNRDFADTLAKHLGRKSPPNMPSVLLKAVAPLGPLIGPALGFEPNLKETIASDGYTFFASHEKATRELGYSPRSLDQGIRDMLAARSSAG